MHKLFSCVLLIGFVSVLHAASALNHQMNLLDGNSVNLAERYKDKVVLVVNVASKCGLTPQYKGLQAVYNQKKDQGFAIAAFPCNQFMGQEPGTAAQIRQFCSDNYNVTFDLFEKIEVNGDGASPFYKSLTAMNLKPGGTGKIKWNFEKFLIGKDGAVIGRFGPRTKPSDPALIKAIDDALGSVQTEEENADVIHKHLFILSGQSNMVGLNVPKFFTPLVEKVYHKQKIIVVSDAQGGQPIRRWYKKWKPEQGDEPKATGDLYDRLMKKVKPAIKDQFLETVTFIWMQGEKDAREQHGKVYAASLKGLVEQLSEDLKHKKINVVIGRLSDFDMKNSKYKHWTLVREQQEAFVKAHPSAALVDTDDLNDGLNKKGKEIKNDLHYSVEGYKTLGKRFADESVKLITAQLKKMK